MKPTEIDGQNCTYGKGQPEYIPLPARKTEDGIVSTCWKLDLWERLRVLLTGKVFVHVLTFNKPLQPTKLGVRDQRQFIVIQPDKPNGNRQVG